MSDDFTLRIKRFDPSDARLGRHVVHDERSLRYRFRAARSPRRLSSVRHTVHIPILDQGNVGSCTGHAGTAAIGSEAFWAGGAVVLGATDPHEYAVGLYAEATRLDPWPGQWEPDDTGSDGLSVAKALHGRGLIAGYQHATSLEDALAALAQRVIIVGTNWMSRMYDPAPDGQLTVSGQIEGGHEFALDELDVGRRRVWIRNSWGESWGVKGRAWMSWDDLGRLLADDGDCTVLVPISAPPPEPEPAPEPKPDVDRALASALRRIVDNKSCPGYILGPASTWLKGR